MGRENALQLAHTGGGSPSDDPVILLLTFAKTVLDPAKGAYLTAEQGTKHKKVCSYCTASTVALIARPVAAWLEPRDASPAPGSSPRSD
jgi:hypothetical protein